MPSNLPLVDCGIHILTVVACFVSFPWANLVFSEHAIESLTNKVD